MTVLQSRNQYHCRMNTLKVLTKFLIYFTLGWPEKVPERKWWGRKGKSSSEGEGRRKSQRLGRFEADLVVHQRSSWRCCGCRCAWASWCWDGGPRRGRGGAGEAFRSIGWSSWQPGCPFRGLTVYTVFMVNSQIHLKTQREWTYFSPPGAKFSMVEPDPSVCSCWGRRGGTGWCAGWVFLSILIISRFELCSKSFS